MNYEFYDGTHSGQEIDEAVDKALEPDTEPIADSDALITSGAVATSISEEVLARNLAIQSAVSSGRPSKANNTITASGWSNSKWSFEQTYPASDYDLTVEVSDEATSGQYDAFCAAQIVGSASENTLTALGVVPNVDIPIVLTVQFVGEIN